MIDHLNAFMEFAIDALIVVTPLLGWWAYCVTEKGK